MYTYIVIYSVLYITYTFEKKENALIILSDMGIHF